MNTLEPYTITFESATFVKEVQPSKAQVPSARLAFAERSIFLMEAQPLNACAPMVVTFAGISKVTVPTAPMPTIRHRPKAFSYSNDLLKISSYFKL